MNERKNIEELIRSKLGEAEITPSTGTWKVIRRQLRLNKFKRFDPGNFNIFYLGGILITGAALFTLINFGGTEEQLISEAPEVPADLPGDGAGTDVTDARPGEGAGLFDAASDGARKSHYDPNLAPGGGESSDGEAGGGLLKQDGINGEQGLKPDTLMADQLPGGQSPQSLVTYFTPSSLSGCAPLHVSFINSCVNASSVSWSFGTGETSSVPDPEFTYTHAGKYTVVLTAYGTRGQVATCRQEIEVFPSPVAGFEIEEGMYGENGMESFELVNYSREAFAFSWAVVDRGSTKSGPWSANEFQPSLALSDIQQGAGHIRLVAENEYGCTDTIIEEIPLVNDMQANSLQFPTAFSPSSTGPSGGVYSPHEKRRDIFHPAFSSVPGDYHLQVFSRRGELIFESRDIYQGWDGYYHQVRSAGGVYLWVARGTWENGSAFNMKGDVTLLWNDRWP